LNDTEVSGGVRPLDAHRLGGIGVLVSADRSKEGCTFSSDVPAGVIDEA